MEQLTLGQYNLVANFFSFTIAAMGAATLFLWLNRSQVAPHYRAAITISGLVTAIALYHYVRIYASWDAAYSTKDGILVATGYAFNDAYRYVDWLLTVPLLLVELILVMRLAKAQAISKSWRLGALAAIMVILGYPGEIAAESGTRWLWWILAMVPFVWIVFELFVGLKDSIANQPERVRPLVNRARWLTVLSWSFYPIVFVFPMIGFTGGGAATAVQVGYTIADVVSKAVFGILIYQIAVAKSTAEAEATDKVNLPEGAVTT
ncbi:bacteriorhodopsin [Opitutia bacterium ISCC 51]|nr:bacteriorhodopsin [Opitutae bacterium ISCC 51]QXD27160.1 bacteriorhodopsin [Opitutae bacterium ISCC 52]